MYLHLFRLLFLRLFPLLHRRFLRRRSNCAFPYIKRKTGEISANEERKESEKEYERVAMKSGWERERLRGGREEGKEGRKRRRGWW